MSHIYWHGVRCFIADLARCVGALMVCSVLAVGLLTIGGAWR